MALHEQNADDGRLFYPTRQKLTAGAPIAVRVRLGRRQPSLILYGKVAWRRPGKHLEKIRAGVAVEFLAQERTKIDYLLQLANAGEGAKSRRRHERVRVDLPVSWRTVGNSEPILSRLRDIGRGGAFVQSEEAVPHDEQVVLEIASPGAELPMAVTARVAWHGRMGADPGFGVEWRARDAGGSRRIRELVRRLVATEALAGGE